MITEAKRLNNIIDAAQTVVNKAVASDDLDAMEIAFNKLQAAEDALKAHYGGAPTQVGWDDCVAGERGNAAPGNDSISYDADDVARRKANMPADPWSI